MSDTSINRRSLLALLAAASTGLWVSRASAFDKDDDHASDRPANIQLQTIGALGVGYIQSTLGLIGVLADSISKETYTPKQIEDLMNGTVTGLDGPKRMLRNLQKSNVSGDDAEFLDRMIGVFNALQQEARALAVFAKSRKPEAAVNYEKERRRVVRKLAELTQQGDTVKPDSVSPPAPSPKSNPTPQNEQSRRSLGADDLPN